ncbi:MAG: metal-dependent hydrolase [Halobacteriaceae archaeon]
MFIGHGVLAFVGVSLYGYVRNIQTRRIFLYGLIAAVFATIPDIDMLYALVGIISADTTHLFSLTEAFWSASTYLHRGLTHSLLIGSIVALSAALVCRQTILTILIGTLLTVGILLLHGPVGAVIMGLYFVVACGIGWKMKDWDIDPRTTFLLASWGLLSHPFGDVFTGEPPAFFYPLDITIVTTRIAPFMDPTLNLLMAFWIELLVIWSGLIMIYHLQERSIINDIRPKIGLGSLYGFAVFIIQPPSMEISYQFVFSVLAMGVVGMPQQIMRRKPTITWQDVAINGLGAITCAGGAYTLVYLLTSSL